MINNIFLAFIPIFVAVDAIGVLPLFISFTEGLTREERKNIVKQSLVTALMVAFCFIFLGKFIFKVLGIMVEDFMIAGGAILFCIAIIDIINPNKKRRLPSKELGFVPLGTPLIVGPAVLTTSLMIIPSYGIYATLISIVANVLIAGLVFLFSENLIKVFGEAGTKALSKIMSLLLAAIAVMMIRKGLFLILGL
ncbi:MAG: MarC family protein [Candidatus Omnitrophota bacterium]